MPCNLPDARLLIARTHLPLWDLRRWPAVVVRLAAALGGGGGSRLHRFCALWLAFGGTTLTSTDDERECRAICQTTDCLSHVRARHFGTCDAGRHAMHMWLLALAEGHAFTDCAHCGWPLAARLLFPPITRVSALLSTSREAGFGACIPATMGSTTLGYRFRKRGLGSWRWPGLSVR